jgi:hypothetical protein
MEERLVPTLLAEIEHLRSEAEWLVSIDGIRGLHSMDGSEARYQGWHRRIWPFLDGVAPATATGLIALFGLMAAVYQAKTVLGYPSSGFEKDTAGLLNSRLPVLADA